MIEDRNDSRNAARHAPNTPLGTTERRTNVKKIADDELSRMQQGGKKRWMQHEISKSYYDGKPDYLPKIEYNPFMFQCLRCGSHYVLGNCDNCDGDTFVAGEARGHFGVFCASCNGGFTNWSCGKCGTVNPAAKTLYVLEKKSGCFIATAVFGSPLADEVMILCDYRDNVLSRSFLGRCFIRLYYMASPRLAARIGSHEIFRRITKTCLVVPAVRMVERLTPGKKRG